MNPKNIDFYTNLKNFTRLKIHMFIANIIYILNKNYCFVRNKTREIIDLIFLHQSKIYKSQISAAVNFLYPTD